MQQSHKLENKSPKITTFTNATLPAGYGKSNGDLGTNSCVAILEGGKPIIITNSEGGRTTPVWWDLER